MRLVTRKRQVEGFLPIFFLMVILKIPVAAFSTSSGGRYRASSLPEEQLGAAEADEHRFRRFRREPKRPRGPRRGGHGPDAMPLPGCPPGGRARPAVAATASRASTGRSGQRGSAEPIHDI